jgi:type II secretory pathway component PulF
VRRVCQALSSDIAGGEGLESAFSKSFPKRQAFVASMVAAGEAAGDLSGGLQRAAEVLTSRIKLRDQLISVLSYPAFVFISAIGAVLVILLFIVPSIAPLARDAGARPPRSLAVLIAASDVLRGNLLLLGGGFVAGIGLILLAASLGALSRPIEALTLDGPVRRTVRAVVYGSFAVSLGTMLAAGASISEALRLAVRSTPSKAARERLEPVVHAVRQGQALSNALDSVKGFPPAIIRLAAVGEASNALGQLLARGGRLEEEAAMRRIEALGRIAGPALIVFLGALLGILMGGLLSGVSQMGQSVLN